LAAPLLKRDDQIDSANASGADGQQQPSVVQSAQLVSEIGKSDVKIAMQGEQFGTVELHAKVTGDQISASITVEHHETHVLLSADLPALHQQLNERQLRVSEISLLHDSIASGSSSYDGPPAEPADTSSQQTTSASGNDGEASSFVTITANSGAVESGIFDSKGRLSVRA
jgi:flagellar hook-length control protein FliK